MVLNVNLKNRPLLLKHSYLKQSGQQHWWMIGAVWITQGDFMLLQVRRKMQNPFSLTLTQLWNAVSYSKCKTVYQNRREDHPFFPSTCMGKNHRLAGNFSRFLRSLSPFTSFCYTNRFLELTCQSDICYLDRSQCALVCVTLWFFSANIRRQIFLLSFVWKLSLAPSIARATCVTYPPLQTLVEVICEPSDLLPGCKKWRAASTAPLPALNYPVRHRESRKKYEASGV